MAHHSLAMRQPLFFALPPLAAMLCGCGQSNGGPPAAGSTTSSGWSGSQSSSIAGSSGTTQGSTSGHNTSTSGATGTTGSTGTSTGTASTTASSTASGPMQWVGTWGASPYPIPSGNMPPAALSNSVLRQVVHVSLGGSQVRFQFSNLSGNGPVSLNAVHAALCDAAPAVNSTIDTATDTALAFSGAASVTIPAGMEIWSDPVDFNVPALGNVSITIAFGSAPSTLTGHAGSRTTSYQQTASTDVSAASMTSAQPVVSWYYISRMEVMADSSTKSVVAMGDSLTDGRGTDTDKNDRWTDDLEARLHGNAPTGKVGMINMGIGGSVLVGTQGTAAQARFARDVLGQAGVRYVIVFDGVNDILGDATAASMETQYASMISQAHTAKMLIFGATITPFGSNSAYTTAREMVRQQINTYIKSGVFDGYFDFDAAVTDGGTPPSLQTQYATLPPSVGTDGLHMNASGYLALANTVDLTQFTK